MTYTTLLAIADADLSSQARALIEEDDELAVVGVVSSSGDLTSALNSLDVDAALIHEDLGPLPMLDLVRDLGGRFPHVGTVLVVKDRTPHLLRAAMQAGARDVLELPLNFEEVQAGLKEASVWSRTVRTHIEIPSMQLGLRGRMIALAGAKGGVGTTTLAVHAALEAAHAGPGPVCLVDLDVQAGDVGVMLDLAHRRSIADLVDVAGEISPRQLEEALYVHRSGLRVLLAPGEGEFGEDVSGAAARRILSAIKLRFKAGIVDVGTHVTEANAAAVEMADEVFVVTTPDVPSMRAANRLVAMWERLQIRKGGITCLVNRVDRDSEVQPELVRRVVEMPLATTVVPASFRSLEPAANTGVPDRLADGPVRHAIKKMIVEAFPRQEREEKPNSFLGGAIESTPPARPPKESGQVAVEVAGLTTLLLVVIALLWQAVLTGYTFVLAGHAAREGGREMAVSATAEEVERAVLEDLPGSWREGVKVAQGDHDVKVSLSVPALVPGFGSPWRISASAGSVVEKEPLPEEYTSP